MNVKTAELKNNLSRYLDRIRRSGETIIVCDRDEPVASLSPIVRDDDAEWRRYREEALARARQIGMEIAIPARRPEGPAISDAAPTRAPDGRRDLRTIDFVRDRRGYR